MNILLQNVIFILVVSTQHQDNMFAEFIFVFCLNYNRHSDVGQVFSMVIILVECEMLPLT